MFIHPYIHTIAHKRNMIFPIQGINECKNVHYVGVYKCMNVEDNPMRDKKKLPQLKNSLLGLHKVNFSQIQMLELKEL